MMNAVLNMLAVVSIVWGTFMFPPGTLSPYAGVSRTAYRILYSGSKAQDKGDSSNQGL